MITLFHADDKALKIPASLAHQEMTPSRKVLNPEAWANLGCNIIQEALKHFAENGTFFDVVQFLAQKRHDVAVLLHEQDAAYVGVWRNEDLPTNLRMRSTFFGSQHPAYNQAMRHLLSTAKQNVASSNVIQGCIVGRIYNDTYELTSFKFDTHNQHDPCAAVWLHTHFRHVEPIMQYCANLFEAALEPTDMATTQKRLAILHWWFLQALPFVRGSTTIGEWLIGYVMAIRYQQAVSFRLDPAPAAWASPDAAHYTPIFLDYLLCYDAPSFFDTRHLATSIRLQGRQLVCYARSGKKRLLVQLLKHISPNVLEPTGYNALYLAAAHEHVGIAKLLLKAGANVDAMLPQSAETPLHAAARTGSVRMLRLLLNYGANLHAQDMLGNTALHWAVRAGAVRATKYLLRRGADQSLQNIIGRLPLHDAAERGYHKIVALLLQHPDSMRSLHVVDKRAETALSLAVLQNNTTTTRMLLAHGAKPPVCDPRLLAIQLGHKSPAYTVLNAGVDASGYALLLRAAERGHVQTCKLLTRMLLKPFKARTTLELRRLLPLKGSILQKCAVQK